MTCVNEQDHYLISKRCVTHVISLQSLKTVSNVGAWTVRAWHTAAEHWTVPLTNNWFLLASYWHDNLGSKCWYEANSCPGRPKAQLHGKKQWLTRSDKQRWSPCPNSCRLRGTTHCTDISLLSDSSSHESQACCTCTSDRWAKAGGLATRTNSPKQLYLRQPDSRHCEVPWPLPAGKPLSSSRCWTLPQD